MARRTSESSLAPRELAEGDRAGQGLVVAAGLEATDPLRNDVGSATEAMSTGVRSAGNLRKA
jgi:hypothetical protein